jgi:RNA polymerase sigma factor (sigma-70 family)
MAGPTGLEAGDRTPEGRDMEATRDGQGWILAAVDAHELPLVRYARRLLGDADLAADVVQHAFMQLCGESQATAGENPAAWLFCVCRNRALDHLRRAGRERSLVDMESESGNPTADSAAGVDPAAIAERRELAARLRDLLRELPPPQREAIDLWCEGFTAKEIAVITGRTEGNVRVLTHRGLTTLRSHPAIRGLLTPEPSVTGPTRTRPTHPLPPFAEETTS